MINQDSQTIRQNLITNQKDENNIKNENLRYQAQPSVQGQCLLHRIVPIKKCTGRFILFVIFSILLIGFPCLLTFWYPFLKKKFYYTQVLLNEATHFYVLNNDGQYTFPQKKIGQHYFTQDQCGQIIYFQNRYLKYIVVGNTVRAASFDFLPRLRKIQKQGTKGLNLEQARRLRKSYGIGTMILEQKDIQDLFVDQIMKPFYIFLIFSCLLWVYEWYLFYSIMIAVTGAFGIAFTLIQTYRVNKKIYSMAYFQSFVNILREGQIKKGSSRFVVPGDIVFIKNPIKMPFDGILLHGSILSNQCSITGQSVPILKKAQQINKIQDIKHSLIYEGSVLIQINNKKKFTKNLTLFQQYRQEYGLPVFVIRTNFITTKGQLIRVISFPISRRNVFEKESIRFLGILFLLTVISYTFLFLKLYSMVDTLDLILRFIDLITITVPPGLPVSMTYGIVFSLQKMKQKLIFCTSPNKTIIGGMTNMICFDKTGTLTQDFMDFYGLLPSYQYQKQQTTEPNFSQILINCKQRKKLAQILKDNNNIDFALNNMGSNHTIIKLSTTKQHIGDPMQVKMFEFGQFQINQEPLTNPNIIEKYQNNRGNYLQIYRRFQFDSDLLRMSTIAKSSIIGEDLFIYTKGSPEHMHDIFNKKTIPKNYFNTLKKYTCMGFRILAIGHKSIKNQQLNKNRLQLQNNLLFDGFQIFQNRLKSQTRGALQQLNNAKLPFVMITGDNCLTASSIAFECHIFDPNKKAYICYYEQGQFILQKYHDHQLQYQQQDQYIKFIDISQIVEFAELNNSQLCINGKAFNYFIDKYFDYNKQKCRNLLNYIKVFGRAKPNDKVRIINILQSFGKIVAMCGDGANDCGALKQADIGLSLSQAQASVSAPFTSQITNITSMIQLLKQCRAGLATNYSLFNIMAMSSLILFSATVILQYHYAYLGSYQCLYGDTFCNFIFLLVFSYTGTAKKLTKQSPNCSLLSFSNLLQLIVAFFIQMIGQVFLIFSLRLFKDQIGYEPNITEKQFIANGKNWVTDSFESNILFMYTNFMYIFTLLAFSVSRPWRKQFYTNIPFIIQLILVLVASSILIILPPLRPAFIQLSRIKNQSLLLLILITSWGVGIFILLLQKFFMEPFFNRRKLKKQLPLL